MQNGVCMSSWSLTCIQRSGILKGEEPVARSKARPQIGERFYRPAVLDPSLHGAVIEAQREGRVRIHMRAVNLEARGGDSLRRRRRDRRFHLVLISPANGAGFGRRRARASSIIGSSEASTAGLALPATAACALPHRRASFLRRDAPRARRAIPWTAACAPPDDPDPAIRACVRARRTASIPRAPDKPGPVRRVRVGIAGREVSVNSRSRSTLALVRSFRARAPTGAHRAKQARC